jgi:hypothetical protein
MEISENTYSNNSLSNSTITSSNISIAKNVTILEINAINKCFSPIKKACQDSLNNECSTSKLYQFIGELSPSISGSSLPDACKNIDFMNPEYTLCFD